MSGRFEAGERVLLIDQRDRTYVFRLEAGGTFHSENFVSNESQFQHVIPDLLRQVRPGGVYVGGSLAGTPLVNTGLLAFGAAIASLVGTTGASVLLILANVLLVRIIFFFYPV